MPYTITTKPPAAPLICTRLPPKAAIRKPATMAVTNPASGWSPQAIANAIEMGRATMLTVKPAPTSLTKRWRL